MYSTSDFHLLWNQVMGLRPSPISLPLTRTLASRALSCKSAPELASAQWLVLRDITAPPLAPLSIWTPYLFAGMCKIWGQGSNLGEGGQCLITTFMRPVHIKQIYTLCKYYLTHLFNGDRQKMTTFCVHTLTSLCAKERQRCAPWTPAPPLAPSPPPEDKAFLVVLHFNLWETTRFIIQCLHTLQQRWKRFKEQSRAIDFLTIRSIRSRPVPKASCLSTSMSGSPHSGLLSEERFNHPFTQDYLKRKCRVLIMN